MGDEELWAETAQRGGGKSPIADEQAQEDTADSSRKRTCWTCKEEGHLAKECPQGKLGDPDRAERLKLILRREGLIKLNLERRIC